MIYAKFIGESSCGFTHGHTYNLYTDISPMHSSISKKQYIWVYTETHFGECPYESVEAFLKNWEIIKIN